MLKAVTYLRVSGRGQIEGDGFTRQRDTIERFAKASGIELVGEFRDEGVSGTTEFADRDGFRELLARIAGNCVRTVIVERADRLARDLIVGELLLAELRKLGVKVITADCGAELTVADDDPTRKLIRQILGAVAEFDRAITVAKLAGARRRARQSKGRCEGRKPFGEREGEADTLRRIRELARKPKSQERRSLAKIAAILNDEKRPTRTGKPWAAGTVRGILERTRGGR